MKNLLLWTLLVVTACQSPQPTQQIPTQSLDLNKTLTTIAFGSCNDQKRPQDIWQYIVNQKPDLWIWLGDNVYADTEDMSVMKAKYDQQNAEPEYQKLKAICPIVGTWDDHDYGVNDGDKAYPKREESKALLLDFLDVPADAEARQKGRGAYTSYTIGKGTQKVKVILLDARYFRDHLEKDKKSKQLYLPNPDGDILGAAQWQWLEKELKNSDAQVHIIGSGIQVIPEEHNYEKWANFPKARQRFFDLLASTQPNNPVLISGDRHIAELSKYQGEGMATPVYEVTASGLTHSWSQKRPEANPYREGELIIERNFALLRINWRTKTPELTVEIRGMYDDLYLSQVLQY